MPLKKIIIKKKKQPNDFLERPVEDYSWQESGVCTGKDGQKWVLPNNPEFQSWVNDHFYDYRLDSEEAGLASKPKSAKRDLFLYQQFVRSYISPETPYRGLLVYHKLGSGKTRTAIATAEPFRKVGYKVVCMLPASLTNNFVDEVKSWANEDLRLPDNFNQLSEAERQAIDVALTKKIKEHYKFISYNANNTVKQLEKIDFKNTVIIIDEVHNLLNMMTSTQSKHGKMIYKILMNAVNCRIVALSGTPLLNFTYELALLFNILRGYMSYKGVSGIPLFPENEVEFEEYFVDYITEKAKNMDVFKRRTVGLVSYYCGIQEELYPELVMHDPVKVEMSDFQFVQYWIVRQEERNSEAKRPLQARLAQTNFGTSGISKSRMQKSGKSLVSNTFRPNSRQYCNFTFPEGIERPKSISKATREILSRLKLPQDVEKWTITQIDELTLLFSEEIHEEHNEQHDIELDQEAYDNFINNWTNLDTKRECLQYLVETIEIRGCLGKFEHIVSREEETLILSPDTYDGSVKRALGELQKCQHEVLKGEKLAKSSKKMAHMLDNMHNGEGSEGKKFIYSNFRSLEGVEIFSRVLQVAGYEGFNPDSAQHKETKALRYAIISGAESQEYRRAVIKAFNRSENAHGEYLMAILGTSSAAEGISLKHVRQIHIMEPWWNEVRVQQVVGRGRRIGSHLELPELERNVHVFRYLSVLSESQKKQLNDRKEHESTDEHVFNKAQKKARINAQFISMLKEIGVDSVLNAAHNQNLKFGIRPLILPKGMEQTFYPPIEKENILNYGGRGGGRNTSNNKNKNRGKVHYEGDRELQEKMQKAQLEAIGEEQHEIDVKFSVFEWGGVRLKGLYNTQTGKPKYVGIIRDGSKEFQKVYVNKKDDLTKMTREAYRLYDRVSAETSNEFILRGYLVDKVGLVAKNKVVEI